MNSSMDAIALEGAPGTLSVHTPRIGWEVGASMGLHGLVIVALVVAESCTRGPAPLFDPSQVMQVQAIVLPRSESRMPDKAMRSVQPPAGKAPDAPAPPPPATSSDMVLETPDAPETQGVEQPDPSQTRDELMRELRRQQMLDDLSAPTGPENQARTDPDGADVDPTAALSGSAGPMDPELARYVAACRARILPNWTPLPGTLAEHPEYTVVLAVEVRSDGTLGTPRIVKGTGDPSFDRSAELAVRKTTALPPPPEAYRESASRGVIITLAAQDIAQ
ncbi:MAG: TonB family protein [Myxococcota bacterium]|nr:TonB family protein [Myxococcota bacterium]